MHPTWLGANECSISERCRCERLAPNLYYRWSKDFLGAGKKRLAGHHDRVTIVVHTASLGGCSTMQ